MPSFISENGVWRPAQEKTVVTKEDGTPEIYEGPDRAAIAVLKNEGLETLGMDVRKDPENIMRARQLGMSVEEFLKLNEPPTPELIKAEEEKKKVVVDHSEPKKKRGVQHTSGGFGDIPKQFMAAVTVPDSASTQIVPANYQRTALLITNTHVSSNLHVAFGENATTNHAYIPPAGNMTFAGDRIAKCTINGISSSGNITVKYSQLAAGS